VLRGLLPLFVLVSACQLDTEYVGPGHPCVTAVDCPGEQACLDSHCVAPDETSADAASATVLDAAPPGDGGDEADAAWPPNLLLDPGFEAGDDRWEPYLGSATRTTTGPHGGQKALFICKDPTGDAGLVSVYRDVYSDALAQLPPGAHFRSYAWVRASPTASNPAPSSLALVIRERGGPSPFFNHTGEELAPVTSTWTRITADGVITDGDRTALSIIIEAGNEVDGTCFAIDDTYIGRFE